jgi:two-component system, response regulator
MSHTVDILLVEDTAADEELTLRSLRKVNLANRIHVARDGAEALEFLFQSNGRPKVVLLDLKLPKIDGLEVLRRIKADPSTRDIPVVVVTSSREDQDLEEAYRLGVNSYVVKPVEFGAFGEAMAQLGMYWLLQNRAPE